MVRTKNLIFHRVILLTFAFAFAAAESHALQCQIGYLPCKMGSKNSTREQCMTPSECPMGYISQNVLEQKLNNNETPNWMQDPHAAPNTGFGNNPAVCSAGSTCYFNGATQIGGQGNVQQDSGNGAHQEIGDVKDLGTTADCTEQDKKAADNLADPVKAQASKDYEDCIKKFDTDKKTSVSEKSPTPDFNTYVCGNGEKITSMRKKVEENRALQAQLDKASKSCNKQSYSKHECSKSVMIEYLHDKCKDKKSQEEIESCRGTELTSLNKNIEERTRLEDKYNCKATSEYLDGLGSYSAMVGTVTTTLGMAAAANASKNVAAAYGSGGNVMQTGYSEMAKASNKAANTQLYMAGAEVLVAGYAKIRAKKHKNAIESINKSRDAGRLLSDSTEDADGSDLIEGQVGAHQELVDRANKLALQSTANAAMGTINALAMKAAAKQNQQIGNQLNLPPSTPQQMGYQGTGPGMNFGDGPQGTAANAFEQQANAAADGGTKDDTAQNAGGLSFGSAPGSAPTSGGLAGPSPGANNSMVAMSGGGGGAAGGGGSGGGGGGGSSGDATEANEDAGSVPGLKYESGAGGSFASNAANKHRMNDTGEMSGIGALLEKFLPKKEEEDNKQGNILSFTQKGGERGLASVEEDGSILGPNSNLFSRVSNSMMANLKKGNLK